LAAGLYAIQSNAERMKTYLLLLLVMQAGLMGMFASVDVFFFYFFHELALIPTFIMVGIWGGRDRSYAAMTMTIYLTLGAMLSLLGPDRDLREERRHSFDLIGAARHPGLEAPRGGRAEAHLRPPPLRLRHPRLPLAVPFLGAARLRRGAQLGGDAPRRRPQEVRPLRPDADRPAAPARRRPRSGATALATLAGVGNVLVIGLVTMAQRDLKQMVGYSSVMHMGYAFLGIAVGSVLGVGGVVMLMVAHGLSVALLFLLSTSVYHRTHTFDLDRWAGSGAEGPGPRGALRRRHLRQHRPARLRQLLGRTADLRRPLGILATPDPCRPRGHVISAVYGLRAAARIFFGPPTEAFARLRRKAPTDIAWSERLPALILIAALLFVGVWPRSHLDRDQPRRFGRARRLGRPSR
jgi:NADH-quinone oxidoreductase subunit M